MWDDKAAFRSWCRDAEPVWRPGRLNLLGLTPLLAAEIKYGMFVHGQRRHHSKWPLGCLQRLANRCRAQHVGSLMAVEPKDCTDNYHRIMVTAIRDQLRLVYYSPADTKDAGFIEFDHFGSRLATRGSFWDLTVVSQRWLRDLLWDYFAERMRQPSPPRSDTPYDGARRACTELSAYLEVEAPEGGHDPTLLGAEHMHAFVADQRHRARNGLPSLGVRRRDGPPTTASDNTNCIGANYIRKVLRQGLDAGETDRIGMAPGVRRRRAGRRRPGQPDPQPVHRRRRPGLAEEANLAVLDEATTRTTGACA